MNADEARESRPNVVPIRPPNRFAPQPRPCASAHCNSDHFEAGELCEPCRCSRDPLPATMVQSTIADGIVRLAKLRPSDLPEHVRLPVAMALADMRRAYDASESLIRDDEVY